MVNLNLKDRKILYELDINSRESFHHIAKKVGLSKDSVIYRIERMKNEGIIKQFHTIIDAGKLGFISFRIYLKFQNTTPEKEKEIIEFLKKQENVQWIVSIEGEYNLGIWVLSKSIKEMNKLWKDLIRKYSNYIEKKQFFIFTKVSYFDRSYILEKKIPRQEYLFITESEKIDLDKKDLEILRILSSNSRVSILEISNKINLTPKTISSRIKDLENKNVILGYRIMFDIEKLGYQYFKLHFNLYNLKANKEKELRSFIKQNPYIIYDNEVIGGDDIELDIQVKSLQDLRILIDEVKRKFADIIKDYHYMLFYKEHKFLFFPTLIEQRLCN